MAVEDRAGEAGLRHDLLDREFAVGAVAQQPLSGGDDALARGLPSRAGGRAARSGGRA